MVLYYSTVHKATPVDNMIATMSYTSPLIYLRVSVTQNILPYHLHYIQLDPSIFIFHHHHIMSWGSCG